MELSIERQRELSDAFLSVLQDINVIHSGPVTIVEGIANYWRICSECGELRRLAKNPHNLAAMSKLHWTCHYCSENEREAFDNMVVRASELAA